MGIIVTKQQVCAFTALTVRPRFTDRRKFHCQRQFAWIFVCDCEGTERLRMIVVSWQSKVQMAANYEEEKVINLDKREPEAF